MLIMQVYHDSGRMPDSGRGTRLWSYARLRSKTLVALLDSGRRHDSDRISLLWSRITTPIDERATCLTTLVVKDFTWPD
jgi:hypothetical protein